MYTEKSNKTKFTIDDFYDKVQEITYFWNNKHNLCHITSRSTDENLEIIQNLSLEIQNICKTFYASMECLSFEKTESRVKIFKYLICNTSFLSQMLLVEDTANGYLVDIQPPFSPYLLIEILWNICYEDILAESILYFPLDLCLDILEILPRCINLLDFQRASKFLEILIPSIYKKLIFMRDIGSQTEDINQNSKKLTRILQELILQFTYKRYFQSENIIKSNQYKRYGILLKIIIKIVKTCFISRFKKIELENKMKKLYNLTFGWKAFITLNDTTLKEFLTQIDFELINLLLKKLKEVDCNIYMNWSEYNDEQNTCLTLQQSITLECQLFIENLKNFEYSNIQEFSHLVQCLKQLAFKPNSTMNIENEQQEDLLSEISYRKILTKNMSTDFLEYFEKKFTYEEKHISHFEILQINLILFLKSLFHLNISELCEVTIKCIFKFSENEKMQKIINITNIEKFIIHNPNFLNSKNLKVILFFLCLKTKYTLKILIKMLIGYFDHLNVSVTLDDLMILLPILKIQSLRKHESIIAALSKKYFGDEKDFCKQWYISCERIKETKDKSNTVLLVLQILQEICLENLDWNTNKLINLIPMLYSFCTISDIVKEIFIPLLMSCSCSYTSLKYILLYKLYKLISNREFIIKTDLIYVLQKLAVYLLHDSHISKNVLNKLMNLIIKLNKFSSINYKKNEKIHFNNYTIFIGSNNISSNSLNLVQIIGTFVSLLQNRFLDFDKKFPTNTLYDIILRYLFSKCTKKQYIKYTNEIITLYGKFFKWRSTLDIFDNIIRLTFEICLFCLEFPNVCPSDNVSFLINCLTNLLEIETTYIENHKFFQKICISLNVQIIIFKQSIKYTVIADSYYKLLKELKNSNLNFETYLIALKQFAFSCTNKSEKLKNFNGPHSEIAMKLWVGNNIITSSLNTFLIKNNESCNTKISEYFKTTQL